VKTFWIVVAGLGGAAAVFFVIRNDYDSAFVAAAVGAVAWFLNYRVQLRETFATDETDDED
jgi:hypothetical protein